MPELSMEELSAIRSEVERGAKHYYHTPQQTGIDNRTRLFVIERSLPFIRFPRILELGYIDGLWTDALLKRGGQVDVVEGASSNVRQAMEKYAGNPSVRIFNKLFQEFETDEKYDTILAGDMIRYLEDPIHFLTRAKAWMVPQGRLLVTVPNSRSMHRRIGAIMNIQETPMASNERDKEVGNQRSYDRYLLRRLLVDAGYKIEALHGCFLKPLSSMQMENWNNELLRAFLEMGDELEDYCWFLYAVCEKVEVSK